MSALNECCLVYVFQYLKPKDWIKTSQVCTVWKKATSKMWGKSLSLLSTEFTTYDYFRKDLGEMLKVEDATVILRESGPFIEDLILTQVKKSQMVVFKYQHFVFRVNGFKLKDALKILHEVCFDLYSLECNSYESSESIKKILQSNRDLKKLILKDSDFEEIVSQLFRPVEELILVDTDITNIDVILPHFANLEKFSYTVFMKTYSVVDEILKKIFLISRKIKELYLKIDFEPNSKTFVKLLSGLPNLSQLEKLKMTGTPVTLSVDVATEIASKCLKLKVVELWNVKIHSNGMSALMSLPNLEVLYFAEVNDLSVPKHDLPKLSKLTFTLSPGKEVKLEDLCCIISKTPSLSLLEVNLLEEELCLNFTLKAIYMGVSRNKILVIQDDSGLEEQLIVCEKKLQRKDLDQIKNNTLTLCIGTQSDSYFDRISEFVKNFTILSNYKTFKK